MKPRPLLPTCFCTSESALPSIRAFGLCRATKLPAREVRAYLRPVESRLRDESSVGRKVVEETKARSGVIIGRGGAGSQPARFEEAANCRQVYLSFGPYRELHLGKQVVEFKHAPRWQLTMAKPSCAGRSRDCTRSLAGQSKTEPDSSERIQVCRIFTADLACQARKRPARWINFKRIRSREALCVTAANSARRAHRLKRMFSSLMPERARRHWASISSSRVERPFRRLKV